MEAAAYLLRTYLHFSHRPTENPPWEGIYVICTFHSPDGENYAQAQSPENGHLEAYARAIALLT